MALIFEGSSCAICGETQNLHTEQARKESGVTAFDVREFLNDLRSRVEELSRCPGSYLGKDPDPAGFEKYWEGVVLCLVVLRLCSFSDWREYSKVAVNSFHPASLTAGLIGDGVPPSQIQQALIKAALGFLCLLSEKEGRLREG